MFEPMMEMSDDAVIKVVGVGGGGGNAVEHMVRESIEGVEFISVNTDAQALRKTSVSSVIQIGGDITKGLAGCAQSIAPLAPLPTPIGGAWREVRSGGAMTEP